MPDLEKFMRDGMKAQAAAWGFQDAYANRDPQPEMLKRADEGDEVGQTYLNAYDRGEKIRRKHDVDS